MFTNRPSWLRKLQEKLSAFAANPSRRRLYARSTHRIQQLESRQLLTVNLTLSINSVSEADDLATRTILITATNDTAGLTDETVEVHVSGLDPSEYNLSSLTVTIPSGQLQGITTLTILDDAVVELTEIANIELKNASSGLVIDPLGGSAQLAVVDNDQALLTIGDVAVSEGDTGTKLLTFTVTLSAEVDDKVTVDYETANLTANAGTDYITASGTLTFDARTTVPQEFSVTISADTVVEVNESFYANLLKVLAGGRNVTIADAQGIGTIENDDLANVSVATSYGRQWEGLSVVVAVTVDRAVQGGFSLLVNLTGVGANVVSQAELVGQTNADISLSLRDAEAVTGSPNSVRLYFNGGTPNTTNPAGLTRRFDLQIVQDTIVEGEETVKAALGTITPGTAGITANSVNSNTSDDEKNVIIMINEGPVPADSAVVRLNPVAVREDLGPAQFTAALEGIVEGGFRIAGFTVTNGDGTPGSIFATEGAADYTWTSIPLAFLPNNSHFVQDATTVNLNVTIINDQIVELNEVFTVTPGVVQQATSGFAVDPSVIAAPARITTRSAIGTIENNDHANITLVSSKANQFEGGSLQIVASVDLAVEGGFVIDINLSGVGANDVDKAETLSFPPDPLGRNYSDISIAPVDGTVTGDRVQLQFYGAAPGTTNSPNLNKQFTVNVIQDAFVEGQEGVLASLVAIAGSPIPMADINRTVTDDDASVNILKDDNDTAPVVVPSLSLLENTGPARFQAILQQFVEGEFQIAGFQISNGNGSGTDEQTENNSPTDPAGDWSYISTPLNFAPGFRHFVLPATSVPFNIDIKNDPLVELDENFTATLQKAAQNAAANTVNSAVITSSLIIPGSAVSTIQNDDTLITISSDVDNAAVIRVSDRNTVPNAQPDAEPAATYTLREAILLSNAARGDQRIVLAPRLEGKTISLKAALPAINAPVELIGPDNARPDDMLKIKGSTSVANPFRILEVRNTAGSVQIEGINFTEAAATEGGAVVIEDALNVSIKDSMFTFNRAKAPASGTALGGALLVRASQNVSSVIDLSGSTFYLNAAIGAGVNSAGGAVAIVGSGQISLNVVNSTFYRNDADGRGGALYAEGPGKIASLTHITAADNTAKTFAGAAALHAHGGATITLQNSIVAINYFERKVNLQSVVASQDLVGITVQNGNVLWSGSGAADVAVNNDPVLTMLMDGGGRTLVMLPSNFLNGFGYRTYKLTSTTPGSTTDILQIMERSPAIDRAVTSPAVTVDQRGFARTGQSDAGAVEVQDLQSRALQVSRVATDPNNPNATLVTWGTLNGADIRQSQFNAPRPGDTVAVDLLFTWLSQTANSPLPGTTWSSIFINSRPVELVGKPPASSGQKLRVRHYLSKPVSQPTSGLQMQIVGLPPGNYRVEIVGLNRDLVATGMSYAIGVNGTFNAPPPPSGPSSLHNLFSNPNDEFFL